MVIRPLIDQVITLISANGLKIIVPKMCQGGETHKQLWVMHVHHFSPIMRSTGNSAVTAVACSGALMFENVTTMISSSFKSRKVFINTA